MSEIVDSVGAIPRQSSRHRPTTVIPAKAGIKNVSRDQTGKGALSA